jgi:carboxyl-terminal processing protease
MQKALVLLLVLLLSPLHADPGAANRMADYDWLIDQIGTHYAYLPERHLDLKKLRSLYRREATAAATRDAFLHVIEKTVAELHDHHATLGSNTDSSPQLIPSGTDIWAEVRGGRAMIAEIRPGSPAAAAGLRAGDEVTAIAGKPAAQAIAANLAKSLNAPDPEAANFALRTLLAGNHQDRRRFTVRRGSATLPFDLPPYTPPSSQNLVSQRWVAPGIGYIRIENSLGDNGTVAAFDTALRQLAAAKAILLDLRNTPSGGNTDVAEPILGRFLHHAGGYQRVFDPAPGKTPAHDSWLKQAAPRAPANDAKLFVLADHWTGSMGEGMTIGLDGLKRAVTVGTAMAGLSGGTDTFTLPHSKIVVHFPVERLYHVDGTPREKWLPRIAVDPAAPGDPVLDRAIAEAKRAPARH